MSTTPPPTNENLPDLELEHLTQLLDAEIILDAVRDAPHKHIDEALSAGLAARQAGIPRDVAMQQLSGVNRTVRHP